MERDLQAISSKLRSVVMVVNNSQATSSMSATVGGSSDPLDVVTTILNNQMEALLGLHAQVRHLSWKVHHYLGPAGGDTCHKNDWQPMDT